MTLDFGAKVPADVLFDRIRLTEEFCQEHGAYPPGDRRPNASQRTASAEWATHNVEARSSRLGCSMTDVSRRTIAGLLEGDDDAYVAAIRALQGPLYRFALRLCRDQSTAEDITQHTFLAMWQSIASFRWESKFTTWVFGIAYRQYLTLRRRDEHSVDTVPLEEWHQRDDVPDPSTALEKAEQRDCMRRAVYALPDPYRETICLVHLGGLTCREAAGALGIPLGTVKSRINGAFKLLRERLVGSEGLAHEEREPNSTTT